MQQTDGSLIVTTGSTRTGKTEITRRDTKEAARLIVWDPKGAWARLDRCERVDSAAALVTRIEREPGALRIALVTPDSSQFGLWAEAAYWWTRLSPCHVVAEETANVTSPGKAPAGWHLLLSQGLEFGPIVHSLTQRPSESDKTAMGNATMLRTFPMRRLQDRRYIAAELDVPENEVAKLDDGEYIERDLRTKKLSAKALEFARIGAKKEHCPIK